MITGYCRTVLLVACLGGTLLSGCGRSPHASFYTLEAVVPQEAAAARRSMPTLAVSAVTLPEMVDRPQLVVRADGTRVFVLEMHRWVEPLKNAIPRLLAENLCRVLGVEQVAAYPQNSVYEAENRLFVDFQRFEANDDSVTIDAFWTIRSATDKPARSGRSVLHEPVSGLGHEAQVAAYSRALATLSREIAQAFVAGL